MILSNDWTEEVESRRSMLIVRDISGTPAADERAELARLDCLADEHFDRIAPPPLEGARRLHRQLIEKSGHRD